MADDITEQQQLRMSGKTHEEIYGENSSAIKKKISEKLKGRTLEDIIGPERAAIGRENRRNRMIERNRKNKDIIN